MPRLRAARTLACCLLCAAGCDASASAPVDAGRDVSPLPADLPVLTLDDGSAPNLGCLGLHAEPTAGAPTAMDIQLNLPGSDVPYTLGGMLEVYSSPSVGETCGAGCQLVPLDALGTAPAMLPLGGLFSVRLRPSTDPVAMPVLDERVLAFPIPQVFAVHTDLVQFLAASFRAEFRPGSAMLGMNVTDCDHRRVRGVAVRVFDRGGAEFFGGATPDSFRIGYFEPNTTPAPDARYTGMGGSVGVANVDGSSGRVRLEAWGRRSASDAPTRLGCETLTVIPDGFAFLSELGPLRSDYPPGDPCVAP